ncbi:hypothetical protein HHX47_DHR1000352 [Lentinula edodes]|nr:hypothetical protein HHX47_DHR1000352 [Lentinula edodes]
MQFTALTKFLVLATLVSVVLTNPITIQMKRAVFGCDSDDACYMLDPTENS